MNCREFEENINFYTQCALFFRNKIFVAWKTMQLGIDEMLLLINIKQQVYWEYTCTGNKDLQICNI